MSSGFSLSELMPCSQPIRKVHPYDLLGDEAKALIQHHLSTGLDYKRVAAAHWSVGIRHSDLAGALERQAEQARQAGDGSENAKSRAYHDASVAHRDAMQRHYDAGNLSDGNAYSTDKIEGGADNPRPASGNALWATKQAAAASKQADDLTKKAETEKSPLPLIHKSFGNMGALAQAHSAASDLWQQASDAYHSGDTEAAKAIYGQASEASARAHDLLDQRTEL